MKMSKLKWALIAIVAALVVVAGSSALVLSRLKAATPTVVPFSAGEIDNVHAGKNLTDCFWVGTLHADTYNILSPDLAVTYWISQFKLPAGGKLELEGQYPHARYVSFASYNPIGQPVDSLADDSISADVGSTNPFLPGASRNSAQRNYTIKVQAKPMQAGVRVDEASRPSNTLFVPTDEPSYQVWMRVYATDKGLGPKGGVELPKPVMTLADGRRVDGSELCSQFVLKEGAVRDFRASKEGNKTMFQIPGAYAPYHPAKPGPVEWNGFYNPKLVVANTLFGTPFQPLRAVFDTARKAGFYSTLDNVYMTTYVDNRYGDALVMRGKAPRTPHTFMADATMASDVDMRYWSFCKGRSIADGAVDSCVFDEQVPQDAAGHYTVVMSSEAARPSNARAECGVAWMNWGVGDGIDNVHGGYLIHRHMKPSANFTKSLWSTKVPGDEQNVLGEYFPTTTYESKAVFEARGCPVKASS